MKKLSLLLSAFAASVFFTGCISSTTAAGAVGADRSQLLLISEAEMEANANISYAEVLKEAQAAKTLNTDKAVTQRVQNIADRLIAQTGVFREDAKDWDWQVNVISDSTVNAWCMPGGKIVVYTGIIDSLQLTDGELAAVMGHEIAHALKEHSREQASQTSLKNTGLSILTDVTGMGQKESTAMALLAQYGFTLPFSRSHETEADHIGTELMARAGYDPYEAVNVWKKMSEGSSGEIPELLSTHPSHSSRIKDLTKIAEQVYYLYEETK